MLLLNCMTNFFVVVLTIKKRLFRSLLFSILACFLHISFLSLSSLVLFTLFFFYGKRTLKYDENLILHASLNWHLVCYKMLSFFLSFFLSFKLYWDVLSLMKSIICWNTLKGKGKNVIELISECCIPLK